MSLDTEFRVLVRDVVREIVREEFGSRPTALQEELLSYKQVRERFKVSPRTLSRWVNAGRLKAYGKGKLRRVRAEDVRACLEQEKTTPAPTVTAPTNDVSSKVTSILRSLPPRGR